MSTKDIKDTSKLNYIYYLNELPFSIESMLCIESEASYDGLSTAMPADVSDKLALIKSNIFDESIFTSVYGGSHTYNTIQNDWFDKNKAYSFVFNITCDDDTDVVVMTHQHGNIYYLWANDNYVGRSEYDDTIQLTLKRGDNYFCFYMQNLSSPPQMFIRVNKLSEELKYPYTAAVGYNNCGAIAGKTHLIDIEYSWQEKGIYKGMLCTFNQVSIDITKPVAVKVLDYYSDTPYYVGNVKFNTPFEIDLSGIKCFDDERLNFYRIRLECLLKDDTQRIIERFFSFEPIQVSRQKLNNEAKRIIEAPDFLESTRNLIKFRMDDLAALPDNASNLPAKLAVFKQDINDVLSGERLSREYHSGLHFMFYRSKIDNQWLRYAVYLPENYDKNKQYPLVIIYAISQWYNPTSMLKFNNYKSDIIIANIPSRGVTLGSYIAEATMDEALGEIYRTFKIDKTRVSAMGYSSGGAAAWLQAELRPDVFAAISPCGGYLCAELAGNLKNMNVYDIESPTDQDHWRDVQKCMGKLSANPNYSLIEAEHFVHTMLGQIYVNRNIIKRLSSRSINEFPTEVEFTAIHNRHLKAYWVTIHSIDDHSYFGRIKAKVRGTDAIEVECENITGFNLRIPPQVTSGRIRIIINNTQVLTYNRKSISAEPSVVRLDSGVYSFGEKDGKNFRIYHGMGVLDVFLKPIRIINLKPESEIISESARNFSSPTTGSYDKRIFVNYPIYTPDSIDIDEVKHSSIIVLDCNSGSEISEYLRERSEIQMNLDGFSYQGKEHRGKYNIMQILKHPYDPECTILYINSNDEKMYRRNLFTRELIIPMYCRYHPFLSNAALIMVNNHYYRIFEYGCKIEKIQ